MEAVLRGDVQPSTLSVSLEKEEAAEQQRQQQEQHEASPSNSSQAPRMTPEAGAPLPPSTTTSTTINQDCSEQERVIVQKPTRKSLSAHVASTIHYLASEVSARSGGPRSKSNGSRASRTSSQLSEPPLTHARPPASPEEVDEQLDRILYAIHQLQQLQRRRRYIAAREVRSLRRAFLFAVGEEQLYRAAVAAEEEGASVASAASSAPTTPHLTAKKPSQGSSVSRKSRRATPAAAPAAAAATTITAHATTTTSKVGDRAGAACAAAAGTAARAGGASPDAHASDEVPLQEEKGSHFEDLHEEQERREGGQQTPVAPPAATSPEAAEPAWLVRADSPAGRISPPPPPLPMPSHQTAAHDGEAAGKEKGDAAVEYSPKAAAADRLLRGLEQYVEETPTSYSFDVNGAQFSWRSIIHTPGERRLQSLVMSLFTFFTGIPICLAISFLLLLWRYTAPLMILYFIWIGTFGRPQYPQPKNPRFTRFFLWRYYRDYFPIRLVVPKSVRRKVDKERNYFFVYHPHGIHTFGALLNFGLDTNDLCDMLPGITVHLQTLKVNWFVPFWRHLTIWMGCGDASASCIRKTLRSGPGQSIMLVVGGAEESLMAKPNANDLLLLKRKGFIKIALQEGTPLVPVYGFGENNVYNVADFASEPEVQHLLGLSQRYLGFAIPLVKGRGFFNFNYGILPHRRPIVVVIGDPIEVPRIAHPTSEDLDEWQGKYIEGLQKLYDEHRGIYDLEATGLRIMR